MQTEELFLIRRKAKKVVRGISWLNLFVLLITASLICQNTGVEHENKRQNYAQYKTLSQILQSQKIKFPKVVNFEAVKVSRTFR